MRAAVIFWSIVTCSELLLEAPDVTFSCFPAFALRLFPKEFFTWLLTWCASSRCNKVWCLRPHWRHEEPSQFSDRCPGRWQLKQSPLNLINWARSLTPITFELPTFENSVFLFTTFALLIRCRNMSMKLSLCLILLRLRSFFVIWWTAAWCCWLQGLNTFVQESL